MGFLEFWEMEKDVFSVVNVYSKEMLGMIYFDEGWGKWCVHIQDSKFDFECMSEVTAFLQVVMGGMQDSFGKEKR